jgi:hypothetical protein
MYRPRSSLFAVIGLVLTLTFAIFGPSYAQPSKEDDGTGAGAGNSPPIDEPRGGAAMPDATAPMDAPPTPPDENAGQAAPEENKTPAPDDGMKKDLPPDPD